VNDNYRVLVSNAFGEVEGHPYSLRQLCITLPLPEHVHRPEVRRQSEPDLCAGATDLDGGLLAINGFEPDSWPVALWNVFEFLLYTFAAPISTQKKPFYKPFSILSGPFLTGTPTFKYFFAKRPRFRQRPAEAHLSHISVKKTVVGLADSP
jgi:hypothetical protein